MNLILLREKDFLPSGLAKVSPRQERHIRKVHRAVGGQTLRVGLENGKMGLGTIRSMEEESILLEVEWTEDPPAPSKIRLVLAMPRPKALKRIIQDITTLGIKELHIIKTWRVEKSYWASPALTTESLEAAIRLGLEQGRDTIFPTITVHPYFKPFVEDILPVISEGSIKLVAHPKTEERAPREVAGSVTLIIGPEGGFIEYEIQKFEELGFQIVSLGDRIMRVETAIPILIGRLT
jgi:RsmE family RNA methyltransferase